MVQALPQKIEIVFSNRSSRPRKTLAMALACGPPRKLWRDTAAASTCNLRMGPPHRALSSISFYPLLRLLGLSRQILRSSICTIADQDTTFWSSITVRFGQQCVLNCSCSSIQLQQSGTEKNLVLHSVLP